MAEREKYEDYLTTALPILDLVLDPHISSNYYEDIIRTAKILYYGYPVYEFNKRLDDTFTIEPYKSIFSRDNPNYDFLPKKKYIIE